MRITILTVGSRGDVQPYIALGKALQEAGHDVRLVAHAPFAAWIREHGLDVYPMAGNPLEAMQEEAGRNWLETDGNPLIFVRRMLDVAAPMMWRIVTDYEVASRDADLILYPVLATLVATSLHEKYGIPICPAFLQPVHPSRYYAFALATAHKSWQPRINRGSHALSEAAFWLMTRPIVNQWRTTQLNLPAYPLVSPFMQLLNQQPRCLYGLSRHVVPPAPDWPHQAEVTGYWFLDAPADRQPEPILRDFLDAGPPPVYLGFGSMTTRNPAEVTEIALEALRRTGQRGLLMTGWGGLSAGDLPDDILVIDGAPHDWLFPRMAAVVHHGGCGTTAAGLRAGVPSIVVPFFADQPYWGARVAALDVGPPPIARRALDAGGLARAIRIAVENPVLRRQAAELGERIRAEDGVGAAVAAIHQNFGTRTV